MSDLIPAAVQSHGTRRYIGVPGGVADLDAITLAELTSGDNLSCYVTTNGWNATGEVTPIDDGRACTPQKMQLQGTETRSLDLTYVFNLNAPDEDKARVALPQGTFLTLVQILQKPEGEELAVGDWYEAVNVTTGPQITSMVEENVVDRLNQGMFIRSKWVSFKQVVEG